MELKRISEWLSSTDGIVKILIALVSQLGLVWAWLDGVLSRYALSVGLPAESADLGAALVLCLIAWLVWRSYVHFSIVSRVERPEAFILRPTGPTSLIGRDADLAGLIDTVKRYRVVLMDGESGCGKSAMLGAGLIPSLANSDALLPFAIREWGDDWERGPTAAALDALFNSLSPADRERLGWTKSADLASATSKLTVELELRLKAIEEILHRRPLLVLDQFDDYQASHRKQFLDEDENWRAPASLAEVNAFWQLVNEFLNAERLHLLVVTRVDNAAGLACVRFLPQEQTATRTLSRVDLVFLHSILNTIAPDAAEPMIVSNPSRGWHQLREQLEKQLRNEGAILMQQVRIVLLGLRQLPLLTPREFQRAGGLRGLEISVIARALRRAGELAGGGEEGTRIARSILGALILRGGPNQAPKARRASISELLQIVGDRARTESILGALQEDEVIRPADALGTFEAWQLDHDYLVRAILAEARRTDRWIVALREGKESFQEAKGDWRRQIKSLLPVHIFFRVCWESIRGRLRFSDAKIYVLLNGMKGAFFVLVVFVFGQLALALNHERLLTNEARGLVDKFASSEETRAVLQVWRGPDPLRDRIHELVVKSKPLREHATGSKWPLADAGFVPERVRRAALVLRERLDESRDNAAAVNESTKQTYVTLISRMIEREDLLRELGELHKRLLKEKDSAMAGRFASMYGALAVQINDLTLLKADILPLRQRLLGETDVKMVNSLAQAYLAVLIQSEEKDKNVEAVLLRERLDGEKNREMVEALAQVYSTVARGLSNAEGLKTEVISLRDKILVERDEGKLLGLGQAYATVLRKVNDESIVKREVAAFRKTLLTEQNTDIFNRLANLYDSSTEKMNFADLGAEAIALRGRLETERNIAIVDRLAQSYESVAIRLKDEDLIRAEAIALRRKLVKEQDDEIIGALEAAYWSVTGLLIDTHFLSQETVALRRRLESEPNSAIVESIAPIYGGVAARLTDPMELRNETLALCQRVELEKNSKIVEIIARVLVQLATKTSDVDTLQAEVTVLNARIEVEKNEDALASLKRARALVDKRLVDPKSIAIQLGTYRERLLEEESAKRIGRIVVGYTGLIAKTTNQELLKREATELRSSLSKEFSKRTSLVFFKSRASAYSSVVARLPESMLDDEIAELRKRLLEETQEGVANVLADVYVAAISRLNSGEALSTEAAAIRSRLQSGIAAGASNGYVYAYSAVIAKFRDESFLEIEAAALRKRLSSEGVSKNVILVLAKAYTAVAQFQATSPDLNLVVTTLRKRLEQESRRGDANMLAQAYASVAGILMEHAGAVQKKKLIEEILMLSSHPFVDQYDALLFALNPKEAKNFNGYVGAAASWARKDFGIRLETLRPTTASL